ncbi:cyclic nucleotide-binding protein [Chryseobacterium lactis]|uniref:Crp/Fnr family transcriptional regulator n=1 Tax=Chryseobacterium lactis TaxID=1241981 RepID=A0A3G6RI23_CHRLC|nr:Crp/Fnr family transcriptional regulator [Chryseobacterium lactis]AZA84314.1 Crp/Fnr family transcriptional regulator [Chryseobacterium lactis]AZB04702.1 Crp/Fnr family transcriptional regulator [Chryseobacterium lactis]PNW14433.1 cyclic nucleotide-binding protein [Chryseobacterium lactis]
MHESLINYIQRHSAQSLSEADIEFIKSVFIPKKIRKRQYFLQAGEVCKYSAFIVKGAMRQYSVDEKGVEHVVRLSLEDWWVVDRESFTMLIPSAFNIDAWEDTEVLLVSKADSVELMKIPAFNEMARVLDDKHSFSSQKRINAFISQSAEQRYIDFLTTYPAFLQRFPQHLVASYLGITKETLSRIRTQMVRK